MRQQQSRILEPVLVLFLLVSLVGVLGGTLGGCGYDGPGAGHLISDVPGDTTTDVPDPTPDPDPSITNIQPVPGFAGTTVLVSGNNWRDGDAVRFTGAADWPYSTGTVGVHNVVDVNVAIGEDAYSGMVSMIRSTGTFDYQVVGITPVVNTVTGSITAASGGTLIIGGNGFNWADATANLITIADGTPASAPASAVSSPAGDNTLDVTFASSDVAEGTWDLTVTVGGQTSAVYSITVGP